MTSCAFSVRFSFSIWRHSTFPTTCIACVLKHMRIEMCVFTSHVLDVRLFNKKSGYTPLVLTRVACRTCYVADTRYLLLCLQLWSIQLKDHVIASSTIDQRFISIILYTVRFRSLAVILSLITIIQLLQQKPYDIPCPLLEHSYKKLQKKMF
jgi:hypothetical protein